HLVRLSGVRQREHHVLPRHHADVAVHPFGGVEDVGGVAGARGASRDLPADEPGLAHARDDDPSPAAAEKVHRSDEAVVETATQGGDGRGLQAQDTVRHGEQPLARGHLEAPPRAEATARISSRSRGRSSRRSMFGPSESGRPSGRVRSGSSWISMKSASTPNATAARASAGTYCRSPPERSPAPPGSWTECVASKITGQPKARMIGSPRKSTTRLL